MSNVANLNLAPMRPTSEGNLAIGKVNTNPSAGVTAAGQVGLPIVEGAALLPWTPYQLPNLTAASSNYFATTFASGTGVTTKTAAAGTLLNGGKMPQLTDASGYKFTPARNLVITSSGSKSCVFTIIYIDENGRLKTKVLTISLTTAGYATVLTAKAVISISLAASASDVNITYGYGNAIGLPHPLYSLIGNKALYNAAGTLFPNTPVGSNAGTPGYVSELDNLELAAWKNANGTTAVGAASTANLGLVTGTIGTATPSLQTTDLKAAASASPTARYPFFQLPSNYVSGSPITLRANAGMLTNVADVVATVDFSAYKNGAGSDLVTTAATSMNFLTAANYDFVVTPTGLVAGDWLDILITVTIDDDATGTAVIGKVNKVTVIPSVLADTVVGNVTWTVGNPTAAYTTDSCDNGSCQLGSTNLSSGTNAPDGTADYLLMWVVSDPQGILDPTTGANTYRYGASS